MKKENDYNALLNVTIDTFFQDALRLLAGNPALAKFALKTIASQKKAAKRRTLCRKEGLQVPPYLIISITNRCNLRCKGCYSKAQHRSSANEMNREKLAAVIAEAKDLGISFIFLAGGEPLLRPEFLEITKAFPDVIFPLFTNGLLLTDEVISELRVQKQVIPIISLEGEETHTDRRRGSGVHDSLVETTEKLRKAGLFFGFSFTVSKENFETLTEEAFIASLLKSGCRLFFFVEYIPVAEATEHLVISDEQRAELTRRLAVFRKAFPGLFVSFPGDEEAFGGCLSAGRGFLHISAEGDLEPCPFAPYSDANVRDGSLKEALRSELLAAIRGNHAELTETSGGCALWEKREWVKSLL